MFKLLVSLLIGLGSLGNSSVKAPVFSLPATATPVAENVYYLGQSTDKLTNLPVEGYAFVHKRDNNAGGGHGNGKPGSTNTCYGFLATGAKWKTVEPWLMNSANSQGLDETNLFNTQVADVSKWEDAANGIVGDSISKNFLGDGSSTNSVLSADSTSPDGQNEVYFGALSDPNIIGVTTVWGIFSGPIAGRQLVEWDMVFNQADFNWSLTGEADKMDFGNISTHELGHATGLADLYTASCNTQTMYGYAGAGETNKQTLESGDIAGVSTLYK